MKGMWRYRDRLPVADAGNIVTLGEGATPLIDVSDTLGRRLGLRSLHLKAEDRNPTGSFKARIASVAASLVRERALQGLVGTSSGNGGAAAAAYAAASGTRAVLFTLADTAPVKMLEILAAGGTPFAVSGVGHDARSTREVAALIAEAADAGGFYPMLTGFSFAPEAMAGVQTISWEIEEELARVTHVYAPVGGGGLVTGLHLGFRPGPLQPRIVAVHPTGADALALALDGRPEGMPGLVSSRISGLQMAVLYDVEGAVRAVQESQGWARGVSDEDAWRAQAMLARMHGVLVEPAGAVALAGLIADVGSGIVGPDDSVVLVLTGAGHKDPEALQRITGTASVPSIEPGSVSATLRAIVKEATW